LLFLLFFAASYQPLGSGFRRNPEPPTVLAADLVLLDRIGRADRLHRTTQTRVGRIVLAASAANQQREFAP
jgi:hypothetical protein